MDINNKFTKSFKEAFLFKLEINGGNVHQALEGDKNLIRMVYRHRDTDEEFRKQWVKAIETGAQRLEDEALRRAIEGVDEPLMYQGEIATTVKRYSDPLLMFLLRARKPDVYGDKKHVTLEGGENPIKHRHSLSLAIQSKLDEVYKS